MSSAETTPVDASLSTEGPRSLPVLNVIDIERAATDAIVFDSVRTALIAHAHGKTLVPPPLHFAFADRDADCHVKVGWLSDAKDFTVKITAGFYDNHKIGLPANDGLVCVMSADTGQVRAILDDQGFITAIRTAAAGALSTHALARPDASTLAVFGTGEQAMLQVEWLAKLRQLGTVLVHGRSQQRMNALVEVLASKGFSAVTATMEEAAKADMIVTTTAATSPVLEPQYVRPGTHVTGIGTDMHHKNELPAQLFSRAALIATDDHTQCLDHGSFGWAVRSGAVAADSDSALGDVLLNTPPRTDAEAVTIADLTGVGAVDAVLAAAIVSSVGI